MSDPIFLSVEQVERLHEEAVKCFGGTHGLREKGLLESAVTQPQNLHHYQKGDLYEIAAAYTYHIAENQPFLDGNKRAAAGSAIAFLLINGMDTIFDPMALYDAMIGIANKEVDNRQLAELFRELCEGK